MSELSIHAGSRFRHYKGGNYLVVGVGQLEADHTEVVIYHTVDSDALRVWWVRPREDFEAMIMYGGKAWPRFARMRIHDCDCGLQSPHPPLCSSNTWIVDDPRMPTISALWSFYGHYL